MQKIPKEEFCQVQEDEVVDIYDDMFQVNVEEGVYCVTGGYITYLIESTNFEDYESVNHFQDALRRKGVIEALEKEGIQEGDTVRLYDIEFEFVY